MTARQHMRRLLVTWLALLALSACGSSAPTPAGAPTPTAGPSERAKIVLVLWHAWPAPDDRALAGLVDRYNRTTPSVQIVLQARPPASLSSDLGRAVAEGGGPHLAIVQSHGLGGLVEAGSLLPLDGMLGDEELGGLIPAALGGGQLRSAGGARALYGLPLSFDTLALYYNKANFSAAPPADTAALLTVARGLTDTASSPPTWGLALNLGLDRTIGYLYAFGGRVFDERSNLVLGGDGRAGAAAWLRWLMELQGDTRILASTDGISVDSALMTRQALMTIDWAHALRTYSELWPETMGVAALPRLSAADQPPQAYVQSDLIVLNARASAAESQAAASFMRYLIDSPAQADLLRAGRQPARSSLDLGAVEGLDPGLRAAAEVFRAQAEQGQPMPNSRQANELVWGALSDMQANVLRRLIGPDQAISDADALLRDRLAVPPQP